MKIFFSWIRVLSLFLTGSSKGEGRRSQDFGGTSTSSDLNASLEQSQTCLRDLQQSILSSPIRTARERQSGDFNESFEEAEVGLVKINNIM